MDFMLFAALSILAYTKEISLDEFQKLNVQALSVAES